MCVSWVIIVGGLGTLMPLVFFSILEDVPVVHMGWICFALTGFAWWGYSTQLDSCLRAAQPIACAAATLLTTMVVGCLCFEKLVLKKKRD